MGDNSSGFTNETDLHSALNNKLFRDINPNLQNFIRFMSNEISESDLITCRKRGGQIKCDLEIDLKSTLYHVSIKKGSGNSVHQETIDNFIEYLKSFVLVPENIEYALRYFIWGDQTIDGKGLKENRLSASQLKKTQQDIITTISDFFLSNRDILLDRFLFTGKEDNAPVDYIYYGIPESGLWASRQEIIDFMQSVNNSSSLSIYNLSFQAWNRAINGTRSEHKRGVIQLKWGSLKANLETIKELRNDQK